MLIIKEFSLTTPVVFIIFNRPESTQKVFNEIRRAKPKHLMVIADGPRFNKFNEESLCQSTRRIIEQVDWPCLLETNFSDVNMGCKNRVSTGLDWVFSRVESAIILEDDCLPHPTFFRFCQELLERYSLDQRVSMIGGTNFQGEKYGDGSYYFSRYAHIWGWATWSRAWRKYDVKASIWPEFHRQKYLYGLIKSRDERAHWEKVFSGVFLEKIDTWDYQWVLTSWSQGWVSIIPNVNLVSNIGFGAGATHTTGPSLLSNLPTCEIEFPLIHPSIFLPSWRADENTGRDQYIGSLLRKAIRKLKTAWLR